MTYICLTCGATAKAVCLSSGFEYPPDECEQCGDSDFIEAEEHARNEAINWHDDQCRDF